MESGKAKTSMKTVPSLMAMALADGIAMLPPDVSSIERGMPLRFESFLLPVSFDGNGRRESHHQCNSCAAFDFAAKT